MKYLNNDGTLNDEMIIEDIRKSIEMCENGEIIEVRDILVEIVNAIDDSD